MGNSVVQIKSLRLSDKTRMALLANNKKIWDHVRDHLPHPYTEKDAATFIERQSKDDTTVNFAIQYNGEFCGVIGLILQKDVYRKSAEIGYWVGEPYWSKGIATKAVELIVDHGFEELKLIRIYAGIFEYNIASMKVLEKNGFQREGIARKAVFKNNVIWDQHNYSKLNIRDL